jgi:ribosome biogenesis protein UTP30
VLANIQKALPAVIENLKGGWDNVQSLHLKTADRVALPIWTCGLGLEEGSRWHGLVEGEESDEDEDEDEEDEMDVDEVVVEMKETPKAKGTKRPSEENVQEQEKPKKKAKGVQPTPSEDIDLPAPVPKKKRKSSPVAEPTAIAVHSAIPPPATAGVEISKKKRKSKVITPDFLGLSTPPSPNIPFSTDIEAEADIDTEATERPTKTKKAKRKSKSRTSLDQAGDDLPAAIADLSVSRPEAALAANTEQTNSKQSKKARTLVVGAGVIVEPMDVVPVGSSGTNVDAPVKKKKKLQIRREQEALAAAVGSSADTAPSDSVPAEASTTVDDPSVKKKKKKHLKKEQEALAAAAAAIDGDIDAAPSDSTAIAVTADIATDGGKNRKKKRAKMAGEESRVDTTPSSMEPIVVDALVIDEGPSIIKSRKEQKKARASQPDADMEVPASVTLGGITKEELRQKRSWEGGEKKKEKVLKKSGKSAKDVLLGRKAGQS